MSRRQVHAPSSRIVEGDCLRILAEWPGDCVDAVITDPPWNLGKDYGPHDDARPEDDHVAWLADVLRECARVARGAVVFLPGRHLARRIPDLIARAELTEAGRFTWSKPALEPIVWTAAPCPGGPRLLTAPEPPAGDPGRGGHPCPKPVALMRFLVEAATGPGDVVLDPFAGSGTTLIAAAECGRAAVGIEIDPRYAALARARLAAR
jgi:DNA modification methylase